MAEPVSVVVPARNEAATIATVVGHFGAMDWVDEVVVVDNASEDATAAAAERAGARIVFEPRPGMGHAVRAGIAAARNDWIMKVDADLGRFDAAGFAAMAAARNGDVGLVKGAWHDPADNMPMTRLLVMPALRQMFPGLAHLTAPNSGIYLANRARIAHQEIVGSYAADLDIMLRVYASGARVCEVDIGRIMHDRRDVAHYNAMADTIMAFFLDRQNQKITEELIVMAESADQVIGNGLGVLAARSRAGGLVSVYLAQSGGARVEILQDALRPFPGARVLPLETAARCRPGGPEGRVRFIAPYPAAGRNRALRAALEVRARLQDASAVEESDLLLLPQGAGRAAVDSFRPDFAYDMRAGAGIKRAALERLAGLTSQCTHPAPGPREMFQTFASLSEPLKRSLAQEPRAGAGGL